MSNKQQLNWANFGRHRFSKTLSSAKGSRISHFSLLKYTVKRMMKLSSLRHWFDNMMIEFLNSPINQGRVMKVKFLELSRISDQLSHQWRRCFNLRAPKSIRSLRNLQDKKNLILKLKIHLDKNSRRDYKMGIIISMISQRN